MRMKHMENRSDEKSRDDVSPWVISTAIGWIIIVVTWCWYIHRRLREIHQARERVLRDAENERIRGKLKSNLLIREQVILQMIVKKQIAGQQGKDFLPSIHNIEHLVHCDEGYHENTNSINRIVLQQSAPSPQNQQHSNNNHDMTAKTSMDDADITVGATHNQYSAKEISGQGSSNKSPGVATTKEYNQSTEDKGYSTNTITCSVCLDSFTAGDILSWSKLLRCKHIFHFDCIMPWLLKKNCCPLCRVDLIKDGDFDVFLTADSAVEHDVVDGILLVGI